jgi:hypothetical protein
VGKAGEGRQAENEKTHGLNVAMNGGRFNDVAFIGCSAYLIQL